MNYLVTLNPQASELEKILSGLKSMIVKEMDPIKGDTKSVSPGDELFFLRRKDDYVLRVKATVVRVRMVVNGLVGEIPHILKELQPKLQLTEEQYNDWAARKQILLVEFESAHKIPILKVAPHKVSDLSDWIAFEEFSLITV